MLIRMVNLVATLGIDISAIAERSLNSFLLHSHSLKYSACQICLLFQFFTLFFYSWFCRGVKAQLYEIEKLLWIGRLIDLVDLLRVLWEDKVLTMVDSLDGPWKKKDYSQSSLIGKRLSWWHRFLNTSSLISQVCEKIS